MSAASKLIIEKGTVRVTHELLVARLREVVLQPEHVKRAVDELSYDARELEALAEQPASWLVVELSSDTTDFTATPLHDGSWRYRLQLDRDDAKARARLVRQVLHKGVLKLVRAGGNRCKCEWPTG